jgi:hypothetical protein
MPRFPGRLTCGLSFGEDGTISLWTTPNQRRALREFASSDPVTLRVSDFLTGAELAACARVIMETCRESYESAGTSRLSEVPLVRQQMANAAVHRLVLGRVLDYYGARRVLVATQHSTPARALIVAARERHLPSVYVPHAPFAANPFYWDLPADYAGLWGPLEKDLYTEMGADPERMCVIGSMMHDIDAPADSPVALSEGSPKVLVAPSAWPEQQVSHFVRSCAQAIGGRFAIAPHPRNDRDRLAREAPIEALVLSGVAAEHLREFTVLVQCSSGVALEGLLAGLNVIEFNPFGGSPNYPFIREPHVVVANTETDLRSALLNETINGEQTRRRLNREWARRWCAHTGCDAHERLKQFLAATTPQSIPVLDGWTREG